MASDPAALHRTLGLLDLTLIGVGASIGLDVGAEDGVGWPRNASLANALALQAVRRVRVSGRRVIITDLIQRTYHQVSHLSLR